MRVFASRKLVSSMRGGSIGFLNSPQHVTAAVVVNTSSSRHFSAVLNPYDIELTADHILSRQFSTTNALEKELHIYSAKKQTPVSLKSLMETGKGDKLQDFEELMKGKLNDSSHHTTQKILIQVACFLHRELPVRLAHRAVRLEASPLLSQSGKLVLLPTYFLHSINQHRSLIIFFFF